MKPETIITHLETYVREEVIPKLPVIDNITYSPNIAFRVIGGGKFQGKGKGHLELLNIMIDYDNGINLIKFYMTDNKFRINNNHYDNINEAAKNIEKIATNLMKRIDNDKKVFTKEDYETQKAAYDELLETLPNMGKQLDANNLSEYDYEYPYTDFLVMDANNTKPETKFTLINNSKLVVLMRTINWNLVKERIGKSRKEIMKRIKCIKIGNYMLTDTTWFEVTIISPIYRVECGRNKCVLPTNFKLILQKALKDIKE